MFDLIKKYYLQPAFLVCAGLLLFACLGMSFAVERFELYLSKEPLPIKKPLRQLDEYDLSPYKVEKKLRIENPEIVKSLGTEEYIQWVLRDTSIEEDDSRSLVMLFITYYKLPDRVPHVPEECYTGGGYQRVTDSQISINSADSNSPGGSQNSSFKVKYLEFEGSEGFTTRRFPVLYVFRVNGTYASSREEARLTLNENIFGKYSYFAKIEVVFNQKLATPTKEQAAEGTEKLLGVIMPILNKYYWPDEKFEEGK